jgi:hypothetical protein
VNGKPTPAAVAVELRLGEGQGRNKVEVIVEHEAETAFLDSLNLSSAQERERFAKKLAAKLPIDPAEVEEQLLELARQRAAEAEGDRGEVEQQEGEATPSVYDIGQEILAATPEDVTAEAEAYLADPDLLDRVADDIARLGVAGERKLVKTLFVVGLSRLLPEPLSACVMGGSSSGKSFSEKNVASLTPPEGLIRATDMTPQSLYYLPPGSLSHRLVAAGERSRLDKPEQEEGTRALREMISEGELNKVVTVKQPTGPAATVTIHQKGPIAFVQTTTHLEIFQEDANRMLLLQTDEGEEQTRAVLDAQAARARGLTGGGDAERILAVHHALQRMIPLADVVIPYARRVTDRFDATPVEARRTCNQLLRLTKAVALLYHRQREWDDQGRVIARRADYVRAAELAAGPLTRAAGGLPENVARFFKLLRGGLVRAATWTTNDAKAVVKNVRSRANVYRYLNHLQDGGYIEQLVPAKGRVPAVWKFAVTKDGLPGPCGVVPPPSAVFEKPNQSKGVPKKGGPPL